MEVRVTLVLFNTKSKTVYSHVAAKKVKPLTNKYYKPADGTALRDALGDAILNMRKHVGSQKEDQKPGFVSFFIQTDGKENSSTRFSASELKKMITQAQDEEKWNFVFAGANIDAFSVG